MKRLKNYFKSYIKETILGPFFKLLEAFFELIVPVVLAYIIDTVIPSHNTNNLYQMIGILLLFSLVGFTVATIAQYYSSKAAVGVAKNLTRDLFAKVMTLPKVERDSIGGASLVARLTIDTFQIQTGINQFLRLFLRAPIIVFGSIIMAYHINFKLTLWFLVMVLALFAIVDMVSHFLDPLYQKVRLSLDKIVRTIQLQLQGVRVIRAFNQVSAEEQEFHTLNKDYMTLQKYSGYLANLIAPLTYFIVNTILILVIWQGNHFVFEGLISQGMLVALTNYLLQILVELLKLTMLVSSLSQSFISLSRINGIFDKASENLNQVLEVTSTVTNEVISIEQMSFTYPNSQKATLKNLDFKVYQGQMLGVIGGTGSGKTSLAQLLMRLYEINQGELTIFKDGKSPKTLKEWRNWVRIVPQKAELFKGTIRFNLTFGLEEKPSDEVILQALEIAQATSFVQNFPQGLDTLIEAFGRNLSGGQRQRLTIARAILQKPYLLILDDATSALDYVTEANVIKALEKNLGQTALVLISQRLRTIQKSDNILVLDKGNQVGFATHEELLENNSIYQSIYASQITDKEEEK